MCGLAGIVRFDDQRIDLDRLTAMLAQLQHRGPDGTGVSHHDRCSLVHARLSIVDLLGGEQPMQVPEGEVRRQRCGPLTLVFNGEIYNHRELRRQLEQLGHSFKSGYCDTEIILHGYRQWGDHMPQHLRGMFAIALWDSDRRRLFLCRDRAGKKPLYLRWSAGRRELMFASLEATLIAGLPRGESAEVDREALLTYLRFGYTFDQSLIAGVRELPAAHWLSVEFDGQVELQRYWQPPPVSYTSTSLGVVEATREVLAEAVAVRLNADVPLGCFLSGGVDSSLIAALAQEELTRRGGGPLKTFSVRMPETAFDESRHARQVAQHIGSHHTELLAEPGGDALADLQLMMAVTGSPTADSSLLPTLWLCRAARQHVKVALSGDGGDELYAGYDRYRAMTLLHRHAWWIRRIPTTLLGHGSGRSWRSRGRRLIEAARQPDPASRYLSMIQLFCDDQLAELGVLDPNGDPPLPDWRIDLQPAQAAIRWDLVHYLSQEVLRKVDRASMAVSLEVRCPLLDTQVLDLAGHLPASVTMPGNRAKFVLRQLARELLPEAVAQRPKQGFALPIGSWLRGQLREPTREAIAGGSLEKLGLRREPMERWFAEHDSGRVDHSHRLFGLLQLALWRRWMKDPTSPPVWAR